MLGLRQFAKKPVNLCGVERGVDLDGRMARDGSRDAMAASLRVFILLFTVGDGEDFFEHALKLAAFETYGGSLDGDGLRAEGFSLKAVAFELVGESRECDHLRREKVDEQGHEETLTLDALYVAIAKYLLEEYALVGYVLVDDPEAFVVDGEDEGVTKLPQGTKCSKVIEGAGFGIRIESRFIVTDR